MVARTTMSPAHAVSQTTRHIFSIDVEEYFQVNAFERIMPLDRWESQPSRVEGSTDLLLDKLARAGATATFFTVGWIAERHPALVRRIVEAGHEVASHSHLHRRVPTLTPALFREDLRRSRDVLAELTGSAILGYRAPSFSIIPGVEWAYEILVEEGFVYDSSVFPIYRPGYGNPRSKRDSYIIDTAAGPLREFPLCTYTLAGVRLPAAGGAYLRLLPFALIDRGLRASAKRGQPGVCYLHPWEVDPGQPRLEVGRLTRVRHYGGISGTSATLDRLFARYQFSAIRDFLTTAVPA